MMITAVPVPHPTSATRLPVSRRGTSPGTAGSHRETRNVRWDGVCARAMARITASPYASKLTPPPLTVASATPSIWDMNNGIMSRNPAMKYGLVSSARNRACSGGRSNLVETGS